MPTEAELIAEIERIETNLELGVGILPGRDPRARQAELQRQLEALRTGSDPMATGRE